MSEKLISADKLIRDLKGMLGEYDGITITGLIKSLEEAPAVDAVEVTYCDQCDIHGHCITEDTFRLVGVEKPFCCVGGRREEDEID